MKIFVSVYSKIQAWKTIFRIEKNHPSRTFNFAIIETNSHMIHQSHQLTQNCDKSNLAGKHFSFGKEKFMRKCKEVVNYIKWCCWSFELIFVSICQFLDFKGIKYDNRSHLQFVVPEATIFFLSMINIFLRFVVRSSELYFLTFSTFISF